MFQGFKNTGNLELMTALTDTAILSLYTAEDSEAQDS